MTNPNTRAKLFHTLSIISTLLHLTFPSTYSQLDVDEHTQIAHSACEGTLYTGLCVSTLSSFPDLTTIATTTTTSNTSTLPKIISKLVNHTVHEVRSSALNCSYIKKRFKPIIGPLEQIAINDCLELFDSTIQDLKLCLSDLSSKNVSESHHYHRLQTFLSAGITNQYTCLDGFAYSKTKIRNYIEDALYKISHHVSNSLAMLKKIPRKKKLKKTSEVFPEYGEVEADGFPSWLSKKDRRLLLSSDITYDVVVAKDGSGNYTTINDALFAAPNSSSTRYVIYIKTGAYFEYVEVISKKTNIMFLGDGIGQTYIKGNRSVGANYTTFRSATVAAVGSNFLAKGISFENYAGPDNHQAVALRVGSDFSAFYNCSFIGYQDTLYVHSLRQFYRECDIYGTVDFIFGNAAVVIQKSSLYARKPNPSQKNLFTAQGREDPNQNTGISIQDCKVAAGSDLIPVQSSFKSYLGRPWKEYSRTIFMYSNIGDLIDPAGWLEWDGDFALSTLEYREYMNRGPGSNTSARVTWPGYHNTTNATEASVFTVANFIQGDEWLNSTGFPYYLGLTS